jgi:hypothetical protein
MKTLRFMLIASTAGIFLLFSLLPFMPGQERLTIWDWILLATLLAVLALNILYLVRHPPQPSPTRSVVKPSRLTTLIGLWFEAKERELRSRIDPESSSFEPKERELRSRTADPPNNSIFRREEWRHRSPPVDQSLQELLRRARN